MKKTFIIDASQFSDLEGFFEHADEVLCEGFTSGRNLDAFHDILRGGFGAFEFGEEIELIWRGAVKSKSDLGYAATIRALERKLEYCHLSNRISVQGEIDMARDGQGPTIYDSLVEIIRGESHITFTTD